MKWKRKSRYQSDESEDTEQGEMDNYINRNINSVVDKDVIEIAADWCLVLCQQICICIFLQKETVFYIDSSKCAQ